MGFFFFFYLTLFVFLEIFFFFCCYFLYLGEGGSWSFTLLLVARLSLQDRYADPVVRETIDRKTSWPH